MHSLLEGEDSQRQLEKVWVSVYDSILSDHLSLTLGSQTGDEKSSGWKDHIDLRRRTWFYCSIFLISKVLLCCCCCCWFVLMRVPAEAVLITLVPITEITYPLYEYPETPPNPHFSAPANHHPLIDRPHT